MVITLLVVQYGKRKIDKDGHILAVSLECRFYRNLQTLEWPIKRVNEISHASWNLEKLWSTHLIEAKIYL